MYIVAIAWMYVVVLMAATQDTVMSGLGTLVFYGVLPCGVVMYVLMAPTRAKRRKAAEAAERAANEANATNSADAASPLSQNAPKAD
jgi:TRAP-type C4-dicarboxylate transport system permease small subunit